MSSDKLILTLTGGKFYQHLAKVTHPTIARYAKKCNADFLVINSKESCDFLTFGKFSFAKYLNIYSRVLYVDTDILITPKTKDLFSIVPSTHIGMFNEYPYTYPWVEENYLAYLRYNNLDIDRYFNKKTYYNSGVMLFSRGHEYLFSPPSGRALEREREFLGDQAKFNINIIDYSLPIHDIGVTYNAFLSQENNGKIFGVPLAYINIYHFAGMFKKQHIQDNSAYSILDTTLNHLRDWGVTYYE